MKINHAGVLLATVISVSEAVRVSNHVTNYTATVFGRIRNTAAFAAEPAPKLPDEHYLPLHDNADSATWEKAKCKGANFVRAMRGSDRDAGQVFKPPRDSAASEWEKLDFGAAEKWGWGYMRDVIGGFELWGLDHVLKDLGLSYECSGSGGSIDCLMFTHGVRLEDAELVFEATPYVVDGKTYYRSGGYYSLAFDSQRGVIMALDRVSPRSAGQDFNPPIQGDSLPAIQASSDIMWLYWKIYDKPKGPNYFLATNIVNEETQGVVSRAIRETLPEARGYPAWGGYDFDTDTLEGQAILGTPNALAFSYFLLQHKETLGNMYISQVRVFRDSNEDPLGPTLLFVVEPVPADNANDGPEHTSEPYEDIPSLFSRMKRRQDAADIVTIAAKKPADLPAPAPLAVQPKPVPDLFNPGPDDTYLDLYPDAEDEEWDKAQCKGANFVKAMRGSDTEAGQIFTPPRDTAAGLYNQDHLDDLSEWGWSGKEATEPGMKHYGIDHVLRDMGSSDTLIAAGGDIRLVSFAHGVSKLGDNGEWLAIGDQHYEVNGKSYRYTGAWYDFALDEVNGVLIATDRMSPQEIGSEASPPITGDDLPLIRAFSDMAWISWAALADQVQSDVKNMHYLMSLSISNKLTQRILSRCVREVLPGAWGLPAWPGFEFETSSPQGQAILGTPNAQAFSYLLLQHKKELGNLHISKIRVFRDSNWIAKANLLLVVEPVPVDDVGSEDGGEDEDVEMEVEVEVEDGEGDGEEVGGEAHEWGNTTTTITPPSPRRRWWWWRRVRL